MMGFFIYFNIVATSILNIFNNIQSTLKNEKTSRVIKKKSRSHLVIPQSLLDAIFNKEKKLSCFRNLDKSTACFSDARVFVKSLYFRSFISLTVYDINCNVEILTLCLNEKVPNNENISIQDVEQVVNYLNDIISTFIQIYLKILNKELLHLDDVENYLKNIYAIECRNDEIGNYQLSSCAPTGLGWRLMSLCRPLQLLKFGITNDLIHLIHEYEDEGGSMSDYFSV